MKKIGTKLILPDINAHAQTSNRLKLLFELNLKETFMGQYLKSNNMAQIKIHNDVYYAHIQTSNAYNFCLS